MPLGALHTPQSSDLNKEQGKPTRETQALNSSHLHIYSHNLESSKTQIRGNAKTFPGELAFPIKGKVPEIHNEPEEALPKESSPRPFPFRERSNLCCKQR